MNKAQFLGNTDVDTFVDWLVKTLPTLKVFLRIGKSRFMPNGIQGNLIGIDAVLASYQWKSHGMKVGDWAETKVHLATLGQNLQNAVTAQNQNDTLNACKAILQWGGNRNLSTGAYPFLSGMAAGPCPSLCQYLVATRNVLCLQNADTATLAPPVLMMNSMLTKVHALNTNDGLPIYDSRVAAAIASLVECWRAASHQTGRPLSSALSFPATLPTRTVLRLFPARVHHPGVMSYSSANTPTDWSSAKVRLGWLMSTILDRLQELFKSEGSLPSRMHAFEASLFMIGYDVACLSGSNVLMTGSTYKKSVAPLLSFQKRPSTMKTVRPLSGRGKDITYFGDLTNGYNVIWGSDKFLINPGDIDEILSEFGGISDVQLGASRTQPRPVGSLGQWLEDNGWPSAGYASAVAPILLEEGIIASHHGNKPVLLNFA